LDEKSLVLVSTSGVIAALAVEKVNEKLPKEERRTDRAAGVVFL
jgi:hypothetical protein